MHAILYLMRSEVGSKCSFFRRGVKYVVMMRCYEDESCSKVLNFRERLDDRTGCAHEETVTVIKSWGNVGFNKSFGGISSEKEEEEKNTDEKEANKIEVLKQM